MEVLIASIHKDTVRQYQDIVSQLGLPVDALRLRPSARFARLWPNDLSTTAILDIGAGSSKIAIVDYGVVRLSHTITRARKILLSPFLSH